MFSADPDVTKGLDRLEDTMYALLKEQQETNALLRRLGATLAQIKDKNVA